MVVAEVPGVEQAALERQQGEQGERVLARAVAAAAPPPEQAERERERDDQRVRDRHQPGGRGDVAVAGRGPGRVGRHAERPPDLPRDGRTNRRRRRVGGRAGAQEQDAAVDRQRGEDRRGEDAQLRLGQRERGGQQREHRGLLGQHGDRQQDGGERRPGAHGGEHAGGGRGGGEQILGVAGVEREIGDRRGRDEHDRQQRVGPLAGVQRDGEPGEREQAGERVEAEGPLHAGAEQRGRRADQRREAAVGRHQAQKSSTRPCAGRSTRARPRRRSRPRRPRGSRGRAGGRRSRARTGVGSSPGSVSAAPSRALSARHVRARARVDLDPVPDVHEQRDVHDRAGLERRRLVAAAGGRVAAHAWLGVRDLELHARRRAADPAGCRRCRACRRSRSA